MRSGSKLDMTQGHVLSLAVRFAVPLCLGNLLQQLYHTADTAVVGRFCGSVSLAAVATSAQPVELLLHLFLGLGAGVSILVAQYTGGGRHDRMKSMLNTAVGFLYLCAAAVTLLGVFAGPSVVRLMQAPEDVFVHAVAYLRIIFLGALPSLGYNMNAGVLRGLGDSRSSLIFLVVSCVTNVVLDVVFVALLGMDVSGAALATVISQFISWGLSILYIRAKYPTLQLPLIPRRMEKGMLGEITRISVPLGLNNSFYSVGHLLMQSLINTQGAAFIAGCSVGGRMLELANVACLSLSMAATTYAGQNYGAGRFDRVRKGACIPLLSGAVSFAGSVVIRVFAAPILSLFTSDAAVAQAAQLYLSIVPPYICICAVFEGIVALANGIGAVRYPTVVNILTLWGVRIPAAHLIARFIGGRYVVAAIPISFVFGLLCMLLFFRSRRWKAVRAQAAKL